MRGKIYSCLKTPIKKTTKGSIAKVRRAFPGASSASSSSSAYGGSSCLRDTSSDGGSTEISTGGKLDWIRHHVGSTFSLEICFYLRFSFPCSPAGR